MGPDGRRQIRLPDYDYTSQGWYFVTICIAGRRRLLASVRNDRLVPTAAGGIVERTWREMPDHFYGVRLDAFVVMPDHLHGIVVLEGDDDNAPPALSTVVGSFKSAATRLIRRECGIAGRLWQRSFFDHVIRSRKGYEEIRWYIEDNPRRWLEKRTPSHSNV